METLLVSQSRVSGSRRLYTPVGAAAAKRSKSDGEDVPQDRLGSLPDAACNPQCQSASSPHYCCATAALQVLTNPDIVPKL